MRLVECVFYVDDSDPNPRIGRVLKHLGGLVFIFNIKKKLVFLSLFVLLFLLFIEGVNKYLDIKNESLVAFLQQAQSQEEQVAQISLLFSEARLWEQTFLRQPSADLVQQVTQQLDQIQTIFTHLNLQVEPILLDETFPETPTEEASQPDTALSESALVEESASETTEVEIVAEEEPPVEEAEEEETDFSSWLEEDDEVFDDGDDTMLESADAVITKVAIAEDISFEEYVGTNEEVSSQQTIPVNNAASGEQYAEASLDELFQSLVNLHHEYQSKFDTVVTNYEAMGYTLAEGYRGRFIDSAKELQDLLWAKAATQVYAEDTQLLAYFMQVRLWEGEYLARSSSNTQRIRKGTQWIQNKIQLQNTDEGVQINRLMDIYLSNLDRVIVGLLDLSNAEEEFGQTVVHVKAITDALLQKVDANKQSVIQENGAEKSRLQSIEWTSLGIAVFVLLLLVFIIANSIIKPLSHLQNATANLADGEGDLTQTLAVKQRDEIGIIATLFNRFLGKLRNTMQHINSSGDHVAVLAGELYQASNSLSNGVTSQAAAIEQISASIKNISEQIQKNSHSTEQVKEIAVQSKHHSDESKTQLEAMVLAMEKIDEASHSISQITKSIEAIAFQTNLLALNASVEAARAGVHGKGFSVVAEEIRSLSQQTSKSAKEITKMIEDSNERVRIGNEITHNISESFHTITESSDNLVDLINHVSESSLSQARGIKEIDQGLEQINQIVHETTINATQTSSTSQQLFNDSKQLKALVDSFKLE